MSGSSGFVAVLVIDLHFPDAGSLKSKRKELSSIKAQLHGRMGAAVAEVDHQDLWQRATLGVAIVSGESRQVDERIQSVRDLVNATYGAELIDWEEQRA